MVQAAKENVPDAVFCSDWNRINIPFDRSLLNISSVIHEVYSYCNPDEIALFWSRVFDSGFQYISIRDMMLSEIADCPVDQTELEKVYADTAYANHLADYEREWGRISTEKKSWYIIFSNTAIPKTGIGRCARTISGLRWKS